MNKELQDLISKETSVSEEDILKANVTIDSPKYATHYDISWMFKYQEYGIFCCATPLKDLGKSFSSMKVAVQKFNENGEVFCYTRQTENEVKAWLDEEEERREFLDLFNKKIVLKRGKKITRFIDVKAKRIIGYAFAWSSSRAIKGMKIDNDKDRPTNIIDDEIFNDNDIYQKPQQYILMKQHAIGSLCRRNKFRWLMSGNLNNKNNLYRQHMFNYMDWPSYGKAIFNPLCATIIDSPFISDYLLSKNILEDSTLFKITRNNLSNHKAIFGGQSIGYLNSDLIVPFWDEERRFVFNIQSNTIKASVWMVNVNGNHNYYWIKWEKEPKGDFYAMTETIQWQNKSKLCSDGMLKTIYLRMRKNMIRYSHKDLQEEIVSIMKSYKPESIDLTKESNF